MTQRVESNVEARPTMRFGMTRAGVYCCVQGSVPLDQAAWENYVNDMRREADRMKGVVVYSAGSGPDAKQRTLVADMWKARGKMPIVAVMSESTVIRGMITALTWLLSIRVESGLCAYHPRQAHLALQKMGLGSANDRVEVFMALQRFAKDIGHPELIDRVSVVGE